MKNTYRISDDGTHAIVDLTQGQVTLVDVEDLEKIGEYRWHASWQPSKKAYYVIANVKRDCGKRTTINIGRLIMDAEKGFMIDHIDGNPLNNARDNLRSCSCAQNNLNRGKSITNTSGHKGIQFRRGKYEISTRTNGKYHYIGSSKSFDEAVEMYESAAKELHGEFYRSEDSITMEKYNKDDGPLRRPIKINSKKYGIVYKIPLTQGQFAIVDIEDIDLVKDRNWFAAWGKHTFSYYAQNATKNSDGKLSAVHMQRVIMNAPKGVFVDHINGDTLDNRRCNLRIATQSENMRNRGKMSLNTSGYKGVHAMGKKWGAKITIDKKQIHLGTFDTPEEAHAAYCKAALELHGEFANFG